MEYPYTIIFRIGMMYSLFITFLELLFIKWWIDSFPFAKRTKRMVLAGTIGLAGFGLFVACIDRKRINYVVASEAVTVGAIGMAVCIALIMHNLSSNRSQGVALANEKSWLYKKVFSLIYGAAFACGVLIYSGFLDLDYKPWVEYASVISASLFFWSFSIDFKKFKMDVERFTNPTQQILVQWSLLPQLFLFNHHILLLISTTHKWWFYPVWPAQKKKFQCWG